MMKKLSSTPSSKGNITVLAVSPDSDDGRSFEELLHSDTCSVRIAKSCRDALKQIRDDAPSVIACEKELPDGTWKDLFSLMHGLKEKPPMIVMSRNADERLWAEVLNLGGYDVLAKPLERKEVSRVVAMAYRFGRALQPA